MIANIEKTICDIKIPSDKCLKNYGRFIADDQFTVYDEGHRTGTRLRELLNNFEELFVFVMFRTIFLFDQVLLICKVKVRIQNNCEQI